MFFLKKTDRQLYDWVTDWTILIILKQYNNWVEKRNYNIIYIYEGLPINKFLFSNNLTWVRKNNIWHFFFSGFYFDEMFSKFIKSFFKRLMILPSFFVLDKWLSYWTGGGLLNTLLNLFNKIFYIEKINYFTYLFILLFSIIFFIFFIYLSFIFLF